MNLYYLPPSHFCEKARAILAYKKIPFHLVNVEYGDHTPIIKVSGQDYAPYIEIPGEKTGITFADIADWAEKVAPDPTIYPDGTRARSRIIEHWAHNVVEEMVWRYVVADVPKVLKADRERWIFVEMQERKRGSLDLMAGRKQEFLGGVVEVCGLAQDLLGKNDFLFGTKASLADFALFGALHPLPYSHNEIPKEFGLLRSWHARVAKLAGG